MRSQLEPTDMNISIYDITEGSPQLIYLSEAKFLKDPSPLSSKDRQLQEQWTRHHILKYGSRLWELTATPTLKFISQHSHSHWEVLMIGFLLSGLMASYFLILANRHILIEKQVQERTNELATINTILQEEIHERQRIEEDFTRTQRNLQRRHEALEYLTKLTTSELRHAIHEVILRTASVM